ncbi:MAG: GNAT family N-acetyltransferase [Spirochaetaceae bacterium]|jgi:Leu/Phe-tRNA-protein transferase|nr:GNAT family N-acetyltransferase [Spirochaetaceae bacterium]
MMPGDNFDAAIDVMLRTGYREEFCVAADFDPVFLADMMAAGFLIMSAAFPSGVSGDAAADGETAFLLLPKLHLERSVLFWENLHETKSARRALTKYELRYDADFDVILERCAEVHGEEWLTPPLRAGVRAVRDLGRRDVRPVSFGVYRDGTLRAGEFGVCTGRVYTSYSGYREENSAGTAQLVLTARWLRDQGFAFWDLGMPLDYKDRLGARNVEPAEFVRLWRAARSLSTPGPQAGS